MYNKLNKNQTLKCNLDTISSKCKLLNYSNVYASIIYIYLGILYYSLYILLDCFIFINTIINISKPIIMSDTYKRDK